MKTYQTVKIEEMIDSKSLKNGMTSAIMNPSVQMAPRIAHHISHVPRLELVKRGEFLNIVTNTSIMYACQRLVLSGKKIPWLTFPTDIGRYDTCDDDTNEGDRVCGYANRFGRHG